MIDAAEHALTFIKGRDPSDVNSDTMLRMALTYAVEIVGEAASKVSESGRAVLPSIPWPQIIGMRNRLVHAYFDINSRILWDTVQLALPPLLEQLRAALKEQ